MKDLSRAGSFDNVSFSLRQGEILGLFGLVGSGRTQVARCIFGADRITSGEIRLHGEPCSCKSPQRCRAGGHRPADRGPQARRPGA